MSLLSVSPWETAPPVPVSARGLFEREKSVQHDLLAVEVDGVRLSEEFGDLLPHLHPAIKAAAAEKLHERGVPALLGAGLGGLGDGARERRRHQLREDAERILGAPA